MISTSTQYFAGYAAINTQGTVRNIQDMIAYSLVIPTAPVDITYNIGAENSYSIQLELKNITRNAGLLVQIKNPQIFSVNDRTFLLQPEQSKAITFQLNKSKIDMLVNLETILEELKITVSVELQPNLVYQSQTSQPAKVVLPPATIL
jgi:hypothetical protein